MAKLLPVSLTLRNPLIPEWKVVLLLLFSLLPYEDGTASARQDSASRDRPIAFVYVAFSHS